MWLMPLYAVYLKRGSYLLRIEKLAIHNPWPAGAPWFYISCAQVKLTSSGSSPSGMSILGAFKDTDPGYTINIYNSFNIHTVPSPAVWTC
jgi:Auxiliary Activity family 9 (formerly GH61)